MCNSLGGHDGAPPQQLLLAAQCRSYTRSRGPAQRAGKSDLPPLIALPILLASLFCLVFSFHMSKPSDHYAIASLHLSAQEQLPGEEIPQSPFILLRGVTGLLQPAVHACRSMLSCYNRLWGSLQVHLAVGVWYGP